MNARSDRRNFRPCGMSTVSTLYFMPFRGTLAGLYEADGSTIRKYYSIPGMTVAMKQDSGSLQYLLTDQLGSVVAITDINANITSQQRYLPFGQVRTDVGNISQTDFAFTGQRNNTYINLDDYKFRWYSADLGRFISPDDIIPDEYNPQSLNRYAYALGNPIRYNDPTGHFVPCGFTCSLWSSVQNAYALGWTNFRTAWSIATYPQAAPADRRYAGAYVVAWGGAHFDLSLGLSLLDAAAGPEVGCEATKCDDKLENLGKPDKDTQVVSHPEVSGSNVNDTNVVDEWNKYLGDGPYTNEHPRTGEPDPDRIVSPDGTRSIRYGSDEWSNPSDQHYHEEQWDYDSENDTMDYYNTRRHINTTQW